MTFATAYQPGPQDVPFACTKPIDIDGLSRQGDSLCVLVGAADAPTKRAMIRDLEEAGHRVAAAAGDLESLEGLAALHPVDLVVLDLSLSGDAVESARALRSRWGVETLFVGARKPRPRPSSETGGHHVPLVF